MSVYYVDTRGRLRARRRVREANGRKSTATEILKNLHITKREESRANKILLEMGLI